ncbi:hypothetical protein [Almyronema epifaneia]|uniref:Uncharacterized protein n=1 Tax=Almyronema epifaneia S1 TaxID=2991925 RepID=A0ABW6IFL6_9CYAN
MLVILMDDQLLLPQKVCQSCLMADQTGQPRWRQGRLRCGRLVEKLSDTQPDQYECQMGFRVANIE